MSGEKLTINENGLVTHIENNTLSEDLSAYEAIEDLQYDYSSPYVLPTLSPTEDVATSNIFSMSHDIDGKMRISGDDADIEINTRRYTTTYGYTSAKSRTRKRIQRTT